MCVCARVCVEDVCVWRVCACMHACVCVRRVCVCVCVRACVCVEGVCVCVHVCVSKHTCEIDYLNR